MSSLPKVVFTDIDGVWTDGGMYYDGSETELKKFNTSDSVGVLFLRLLDIPLVVITGEDTPIVTRRCKKLKIDSVFLGAKNKLKIVREYCLKNGTDINDIAYVGDDINDIELLKSAGYSAVPAGVPEYVSRNATVVLSKKGGEGAFREFVEKILVVNNMLEKVLDLYLHSKDLNQ